MFEIRKMKIYVVTMSEVIKRLEKIQDIELSKLRETIENAFDEYDVDGVEELIGQDKWCDYTNDGEYQLNIKIDHEDAYEFTIHIKIKNNIASVIKVL